MDWFAKRLLTWHDQHGRKDLPWQQDIDPYRVWVSEIMLQQTQVATVIDYYNRFIQRFPDVDSLAGAPLDEVLHQWTGLGYYARARNLHKTAKLIVDAGEFPQSQDGLESLPGIGRSTAGAIRAIAMQQRAAILDGNVKRVLARFHAVAGYPGISDVSKTLWQYAEAHTPAQNSAAYTQAIMDLGATLCTRRDPGCHICPLQRQCKAHATQQVEQFPERKPKTVKPVRRARFFVVSLANKTALLEQKPLNGLWGGLWTPLERDPSMLVEELLAELGLHSDDVDSHHFAPQFRHTFTHFHLDIEPVYVQLTTAPSLVEDNPRLRWVSVGDNNPIGLSAPAVKLLASLHEPIQL
jgi:A/G-specific adenine glycosylase